MALYVIGDSHLSLSTEKPMDIFGSRWTGYVEKLKNGWESRVTKDDTVVLAGDISWAMTPEEAKADFDFIEANAEALLTLYETVLREIATVRRKEMSESLQNVENSDVTEMPIDNTENIETSDGCEITQAKGSLTDAELRDLLGNVIHMLDDFETDKAKDILREVISGVNIV